MTVASALAKLRGELFVGLAEADLQDLITDGVWTIEHPTGITDTAGTDYTYGGIKVPFDITIVEVTINPHATLTANDTNYATLSLTKSDGAAGSATTIASQTTKITGGSGDWAADTYVDVPVTAANADVDDGQQLLFEKVAAASGVSVGGCSITIRYRRR